MEWQQVIASLAGSGPLAGILAFATYKMWSRCLELEKRNDDLQEARIADLKQLMRPHDD